MEMNIGRLIPEFIMLGGAFVLLILEFFVPKGPRKWAGVFGMILSVVAAVLLFSTEYGTSLSGLFVQDAISVYFKLLFLIVTALVFYLTILYERHIENWRGEFYSLMLFCTVGFMLLSSSTDFIGFYVSLELVAITLYILATFAREKNQSVEAGLKHLVTGALSSGFLLYGISFIYGTTGSTSFAEIAQVVANNEGNGFLAIGLAFTVIGLTFKVSGVPFHVWTPDVYEGAPTPVTALLAAGSKAVGFIVIVRILITALGSVRSEWLVLVSVISGATLIFGNLGAMPQKNMKRMLAYAGIGSAGYLFMAVAAASPLGIGALMYYLSTYLFAILGIFIALVIFYNSEGSYTIESLAGLARRSPLLAITIFIGVLSLAGVPPLGGFIAKFYIIAAVVQQGLWALAVIGVLMAVIAMYYFLIVIRSMYLRPAVNTDKIRVDNYTRVLLYGINAVTVILGMYPGPLTDWVMAIAGTLF
jgi:NADH-quinone oxidoreductase subunit N